MLPDPFDTLEVTLGPGVRVAGLDDRRVVRVTGRTDHARGNAIHLTAAPEDRLDVEAALAARFPIGAARFVVPREHATLVDPGLLRASSLDVLRRAADAASGPARTDLVLDSPVDDRAWHGVTVLHRHAAADADDAATRARGGADDRLRWWVDGLRQLVGEGRARVVRATRFGSPVGVGALHWAPGLPVDDGHAGLAVVADVVVHPAHRGLGVGRTLVDELVARHLTDFPRARVMAVADPAAPAPPRGWEVHARLVALTRPGSGPDEGRR